MKTTITSVPKGMVIPEGATHYDHALPNPFSKVVKRFFSRKVYRWHDGQWNELKLTHATACFANSLTPIETYEVDSSAERVSTPLGLGTVVGMDICNRLLIDLDVNPLPSRPCRLFRSSSSSVTRI